MPTIRPAFTEPELTQARTLFREYVESFRHDVEFQKYLVLQGFEREVTCLPGIYAPPRGALLLAWECGVPAGCVACKPWSETICEMKRLYVRPEFRGLGLGRALAEGVIAAGNRLGYERMRLDTLAAMQVAQGMYRALGFREISRYNQSPLQDAVYMELDLRPSALRRHDMAASLSAELHPASLSPAAPTP